MSLINQYIEDIRRDVELGPQVVHHESLPNRLPCWTEMPDMLLPEIREGLARLGITRLYSHQREALTRVTAGEDVVVVTPTASGKTLCYNLPVLQSCSAHAASHALYLFPIKALEQDQRGVFSELAGACGLGDRIQAEIYDGDTSASRRARIRSAPPSVIISNPDMVHMGILAYHPKWEEFFSNLHYIILDEVHTYRGVFGSHVAHVMRRLLRVAALYGSVPKIIACSATIANPGELTSQLVGRRINVIDESGAPEAGREFLFINPRNLSSSTVAARLLRRAVDADLATIAFTKGRRITELIYTWVIQSAPKLRRRISAYRAGYLPEERREIERNLFSGKIKGVVSTSALEMGIDIGALDVCILVGYPGAITTTWQRSGRVGRQERRSLIVLIASHDALDQYFMKHPQVFFEASFEPAVIDPGNQPILRDHLCCAASEIPITGDDHWFSGLDFNKAVLELERTGRLLRSVDENLWHSSRRYPQRDVNIRGVGENSTIMEELQQGRGVKERPRIIGALDGNRIFTEGHPGAIYLHRAAQYQIQRLDLERRNIWARPVKVDYFTRAHRDKETSILGTRRSRLMKNFIARLGDLCVTERVVGYDKKQSTSGEKISYHKLDLPPYSFETVGFWIEIDDFIPRAVERHGLNFMGGIHAVEHASIALFPLFALCEPDDVGGISTPLHPEVGKAAIFIYDGYAGGIGLAERSYSQLEELLQRCLSLIEECDCEEGCPACIYSSKCGSGNVPLDKDAAVMVISLLLDRPAYREWVIQSTKVNEQPFHTLEEFQEPKENKTRILILDIETQRGAEEVGGWGNIHLMGLAVAVVKDVSTGRITAYYEKDIEELLRTLRHAQLVVGFNLLNFDYRVLSAYDRGSLMDLPTFDILQDIHRRLGYRLSLAHLVEQTLGESKSADGLQSLQWVQEGRMDLVEEYCRRDVEVTERLFYHGLEKGWIRFRDREGRQLELRLDWDIDALIRQ